MRVLVLDKSYFVNFLKEFAWLFVSYFDDPVRCSSEETQNVSGVHKWEV